MADNPQTTACRACMIIFCVFVAPLVMPFIALNHLRRNLGSALGYWWLDMRQEVNSWRDAWPK